MSEVGWFKLRRWCFAGYLIMNNFLSINFSVLTLFKFHSKNNSKLFNCYVNTKKLEQLFTVTSRRDNNVAVNFYTYLKLAFTKQRNNSDNISYWKIDKFFDLVINRWFSLRTLFEQLEQIQFNKKKLFSKKFLLKVFSRVPFILNM